MDLLTAIATCSLHSDFALILAMALTFSGGNPYNVEDATAVSVAPNLNVEITGNAMLEQPPSAPRNRADALVAFERIKARDGAPLLGLLPVQPSWAAMFGRKPADLFNPCINLSIATARLSEFEYECGPRASRGCVLKKYARAIDMNDFELRVDAQLRANKMPRTTARAIVVESDAMFEAPIVRRDVEDRAREWGPDRILFPELPKAPANTNIRVAQKRR